MLDQLSQQQNPKGCTIEQILRVTRTQHCSIEALVREGNDRLGHSGDPAIEAEQIRQRQRVYGPRAVWWGNIADVVQYCLRLQDTDMPRYPRRSTRAVSVP